MLLDPIGLTTTNLTTDSNGFETALFANTGALIVAGQTFSFQWAILDPTNGNLAFSNAASVLVQ